MRLVPALLALAAATSPASADSGNLENWLVGPVIGFRIGGHPKSSLVIGLEGGGGFGPERFNLGFEHRDDTDVGYVELDPWYLIGGSLGVGIDNHGNTVPILGLWEGLPLTFDHSCSGWHSEVTVSGGYRYTGVHELYMTVKAGQMNGEFCID